MNIAIRNSTTYRPDRGMGGLGACNTTAAFAAANTARLAAGQRAGTLTAQLTTLTSERDRLRAQLTALQAQTA